MSNCFGCANQHEAVRGPGPYDPPALTCPCACHQAKAAPRLVTSTDITDEQIYAAKHHARRNEDDISVQMMSIALERETSHPAVQIALAYTVDYFNAKVAS